MWRTRMAVHDRNLRSAGLRGAMPNETQRDSVLLRLKELGFEASYVNGETKWCYCKQPLDLQFGSASESTDHR